MPQQRVSCHLLLALTLISTAAILHVECCECEDKDLGCFDRDGIYSDLAEPWCLDAVKAKYGLYTRANPESPLYLTRTSTIPSQYDPSKRTIILIHGFRNNFNTDWLHSMRKALLDREEANVIILGWGGGADKYVYQYLYSASTTRLVGAELSFIIDRLKEAGAQVNNIWCIGHSLGAQTCGYAGERTRLGRLTGLDPADPYFTGKNRLRRVDKDDADFVDVIHTDASGLTPLGTPKAVGNADYYPNGIGTQPACYWFGRRGLDARRARALERRASPCSHGMAYLYFEESVKNPECFKVTERCTAGEDREPKDCVACSDCGYMGYKADEMHAGKHISGLFELKTTDAAPYCKT